MSPTPRSALGGDLVKLRAAGAARAELEARARAFIASDDYGLRTPLATDIGLLDTWLAGQRDRITADQLAVAVSICLGMNPEVIAKTPEFCKTRNRVADSVLALTVAQGSA